MWRINDHNVGATINEQARRRPFVFEWNFDLLFIVNEKEKGGVWGIGFVFEDSFAFGFFVSFLLFLLSQKKKQEKPDGKRKKKKGFPRRPQIRQYRICWFEEVGYTLSVRYKKQCCSDIVFCQISLGGPATFLKGAGASTTRKNERFHLTR